jgi:hypothetical protein
MDYHRCVCTDSYQIDAFQHRLPGMIQVRQVKAKISDTGAGHDLAEQSQAARWVHGPDIRAVEDRSSQGRRSEDEQEAQKATAEAQQKVVRVGGIHRHRGHSERHAHRSCH